MKKFITSYLFLILIIFSSSANARTTAHDLLKECNYGSSKYCEGYISGFYDGRTTNDYSQKDLMSCPPVDESGMKLTVSYQQMILVFTNWAEKHPEKLHLEDWQAIRQAFAEAWPCK